MLIDADKQALIAELLVNEELRRTAAQGALGAWNGRELSAPDIDWLRRVPWEQFNLQADFVTSKRIRHLETALPNVFVLLTLHEHREEALRGFVTEVEPIRAETEPARIIADVSRFVDHIIKTLDPDGTAYYLDLASIELELLRLTLATEAWDDAVLAERAMEEFSTGRRDLVGSNDDVRVGRHVAVFRDVFDVTQILDHTRRARLPSEVDSPTSPLVIVRRPARSNFQFFRIAGLAADVLAGVAPVKTLATPMRRKLVGSGVLLPEAT